MTLRRQICKKVFDLIFSLIIILALLPIFIVIALMIKLESPGPIIYSQWRVGINGKKFLIYKFRSMYSCETDSEVTSVSRNDPRVTNVGKFIRRYSIDEIPQFYNVLIGDMSIVGPRPHAIIQDKLYSEEIKIYSQRKVIKPGITGLAQVNGYRGEISSLNQMENRVLKDIDYIKRNNLVLDTLIILRTISHFFKNKNIY